MNEYGNAACKSNFQAPLLAMLYSVRLSTMHASSWGDSKSLGILPIRLECHYRIRDVERFTGPMFATAD